MYKRLLIPLDGSDLAQAVLPEAGALALDLDLEEITLLHVCNSQECEVVSLHRDYIERAAEIVRHYVSQGCEDEAALRVKHATIGADLAIGHPAEEILECADKAECDLILMSTHGRSGIRRWALGSVADKVLRAATIPIWLIRAGSNTGHNRMGTKRTILVPLDGSELAEAVLPHVTALAASGRRENVDVVLLAVCEPLASPEFYLGPSGAADLDSQAASCVRFNEGYLSGLEKQLRRAGISTRSEILMGNAADQIITYAARSPLHLVAMATHGRSGLNRWVYGSVAEKVLLGASCPLLLVKPGPEDRSN